MSAGDPRMGVFRNSSGPYFVAARQTPIPPCHAPPRSVFLLVVFVFCAVSVWVSSHAFCRKCKVWFLVSGWMGSFRCAAFSFGALFLSLHSRGSFDWMPKLALSVQQRMNGCVSWMKDFFMWEHDFWVPYCLCGSKTPVYGN